MKRRLQKDKDGTCFISLRQRGHRAHTRYHAFRHLPASCGGPGGGRSRRGGAGDGAFWVCVCLERSTSAACERALFPVRGASACRTKVDAFFAWLESNANDVHRIHGSRRVTGG